MQEQPGIDMQYSSLMERYARAMIFGAKTKGYTPTTIAAAVAIPSAKASSPDQIPLKRAALEEFYQQVLSHEHQSKDPVDIEDADVSLELFSSLQRNLKWLLRDDFYGLTKSPCKVGVFLVMTELIIQSNTLEASLERGNRFYQAVTDDIHFNLHRGEQFAEFRVELDNPELDPHHFLCEWFLLIWHRLSCWLIGDKIPILNAEFSHLLESPMGEYSQVFSSNCRFDKPITLIRFNVHFLDKHSIRTLDDFKRFSTTDSLDFMSIPGMDNSLSPRIEAQLDHHFADTREFLSMEDIAEEYHISSQTLRRRLDEEGSSFRAIKEKIRRNAVMQWLRDPDVPISEIARMTGFAEANGLSRAVKAWIGESPSDFRTRLEKERNKKPRS
jgi:AraC-like DNA-binding protein